MFMAALVLLPLSRRTYIGTVNGSNQSSIDFSRDSSIASPVCDITTNGLFSSAYDHIWKSAFKYIKQNDL